MSIHLSIQGDNLRRRAKKRFGFILFTFAYQARYRAMRDRYEFVKGSNGYDTYQPTEQKLQQLFYTG